MNVVRRLCVAVVLVLSACGTSDPQVAASQIGSAPSKTSTPRPAATADREPTIETRFDGDAQIHEFIEIVTKVPDEVSADRASPTLNYVVGGSSAVALVRLDSAEPSNIEMRDEAPCGDDARTSDSVCVARYAFALTSFRFTIEEIWSFGEYPGNVMAPVGSSIDYSEVVGVVASNRPDLDEAIEQQRAAIVAAAPLGALYAMFLRPSEDAKSPVVTAYALVDSGGSLLSPVEEPSSRLWTDEIGSLQELRDFTR